MHCMVLRCNEEASAALNVMKDVPDAIVIEVVPCAKHHGLLNAGEPYGYDDEQRVVYPGADMSAAGARPVARLNHAHEDVGTMLHGAIALNGEYVDGTPVTITFTRESLAGLYEFLTKWPHLREQR